MTRPWFRRENDDYWLDVRERAQRVLANGTTSGSARRLAEDAIYMADTLLARSRVYRMRQAREERLRRQQEVIDNLESQFREEG